MVVAPVGNAEAGVQLNAPLPLVVVGTNGHARVVNRHRAGRVAVPVMVGVVSLVVLPLAGAVIVGGLPLATGLVGVNGRAALLLVLVSPGTGAVVALNTGWVPTVLALGVAGRVKPLLLSG